MQWNNSSQTIKYDLQNEDDLKNDSHTTTDNKLDILSDVKTGNGIPHDTYNVRGIAHGKDDICYDFLADQMINQNKI